MLRKTIFYSLPHDVRRFLYSIAKPQDFKKRQYMRTIETNNAYSYKPFDQNQCIFVHIPKTAGVSICHSLFGNLAGSHTTLFHYQIVFPKKEFDRYFKFTFVRNPWDRVFSAYNFLKKGGLSEQDRKWTEKVKFSSYKSFDDFVKRGLPKPSIHTWIHFLPQSNFLSIPRSRKLPVDFLGFFENIENDFRYITDKLGMGEDFPLKRKNASNLKQKLDYKDAYTDTTRNIVSQLYKTDVDLLGYNFDNSSLPSQLNRRD